MTPALPHYLLLATRVEAVVAARAARTPALPRFLLLVTRVEAEIVARKEALR